VRIFDSAATVYAPLADIAQPGISGRAAADHGRKVRYRSVCAFTFQTMHL